MKTDVDAVAERIVSEMEAAMAADRKKPTAARKKDWAAAEKERKARERERKREEKRAARADDDHQLADITSSFRSRGNRELASILTDVKPDRVEKPSFSARSLTEETEILYQMFANGQFARHL